MGKLRDKLASAAGETLVETLAAILVAALSVTLLVGGVAASGAIDRAARASDDDFYAALTAAEGQDGTGDLITVTVSNGSGFKTRLDATLYGGDGDLHAYARAERGGETP